MSKPEPRKYRVTFTLEPIDKDADEYGFGYSSTLDPLNDSEWFYERIEMWDELVKASLDHAHNVEVERARKAAAPFWERWLGA
jgi:hypothetical protein